MSDETTSTKATKWQRFNQADSWKVALVAVVVTWLGKGGIDKLADRFLHDSAPFEARIEVKVDQLIRAVEKCNRAVWVATGKQPPKESDDDGKAQGP